MTRERVSMNDIWRDKLNAAHEVYKAARQQAWNAHAERENLPRPDGHFAFTRANMREAEALREYRRILEIFTNLAVRGEKPPE